MNQHPLALAMAFALACAGCGGDRATAERAPAGKPGAEGGEALAPVSSRAPQPLAGAARPARAGDLSLRAFGPTPIGPLFAERRAEYPITIAIHNASADPIFLGDLRLHASVYRAGLLALGCGEHAPELVRDAPGVLEAGQTMLLAQPMPCGLVEAGDYEVVSVVMIGAPSDADSRVDSTLRIQRSVSMPLTIDPMLPAHRTGERASRAHGAPGAGEPVLDGW